MPDTPPAPPNHWQGRRVRLRAVHPDDWVHFHEWDQDTDAQARTDAVFPPRTEEATQRWAQAAADHRPDGDDARWMIETLDGVAVGTINTHSCDARHGTFSYGLALGRQHWRKGYGSEAIALVLRFMFHERRYQKCNAVVFGNNEPSLALHHELGFVEEGRRRRSHYANGGYHDVVLFGLTREEFGDRVAPRFGLTA